MTLVVSALDETKFSLMRDAWQSLLGNSLADPLFLSWNWQFLWWQTWAKELDLELQLLAVYDGDHLVGLAPLYLCFFNLGPLKKYRRLQFLGNAWRLSETVRTEYLSFIIQSDRQYEVEQALFHHLDEKLRWDEWVINDIDLSTSVFSRFRMFSHRKKMSMRHLSQDEGSRINCVSNFPYYLTQLGKNTRAKVFNYRNKLAQQGHLRVETVIGIEQLDAVFALLNELHQKRWKAPCFYGAALSFHLKLSKLMLEQGELQFSLMLLDNKVVSVLYNLSAGGIEYNLQSGFDDARFHRISLGSLHLGYAIERAFSSVRCDCFDLLAGEGMNSDYKKKYKGEITHLKTIQFIRNPSLRFLYMCYEMSPNWLKKLLYGRRGFG